MKQGLLFKDAPEARFELYCNYPFGRGSCNILFETLEAYNKHQKEVHEHTWLQFTDLPNRPKHRFHTNQKELDNLKNKKCWCGKSKDKFDKDKNRFNSRFCCNDHYDDYWLRHDNTAFHRDRFLRKKTKCEKCGKKRFDKPELRMIITFLEMDHIIAIILGGHPWDYRNLQALCVICHKIKTKEDMHKLKAKRRKLKVLDLFGFNASEVAVKEFVEN